MATVYRTIKANVFSPTTLYNIANNTASTAVHWADWYDDDTTVEEVCKYDIKAITTIMTAFQCNNSNGAYEGDIELGVTADTSKLWRYDGPPARTLNKLLRKIPQYQCPDFPDEVKPDENHLTESPLDYVASAFAIPFPPSGVAMDAN